VPRAAGDSSFYTWQLKGREGQCDIRLPSVTSIIKACMGGSGPGMAWWGYKLGMKALVDHLDVVFPSEDELYDTIKKSRFNPNAQRDEAEDRGNKAHEYLEYLAMEAPAPGDPQFYDVTSEYEKGVFKWWQDHMPGWEVTACEIPVYSLKHAYAGTVDLVRRHIGNGTYQVLDLKTHKGDARFEDHVQVAAYDLALREMGVIPAGAEHAVLLAREDGTYHMSTRYVNPEVFLKLRDVYEEVSK